MGVIDDYLEDLGDSQRAQLERIRRRDLSQRKCGWSKEYGPDPL